MISLLLTAIAAVSSDTLPRSAIVLASAWTYAAPAGADVDLFLSIANEGDTPFAVLEVTADAAASVSSVGLGARGEGGRRLASAFVVLPGQRFTMRPEYAHLRLMSLQRALEVDRPVAVVLKCANGASVRVMVDVRPPASAARWRTA